MPIYATVDGTTNSASVNNYGINGNEQYITMFQLLTRVAVDGHVTRIAYSTGSFVSGARGTGIDYWDMPNSAGGNSWSVWRFNSSSYRDYEFYVMFGYADYSSFWGLEPSAAFSMTTGTTWYGPLACQVAIAFNPSTGETTNPWNGTTNNDGTDTVVCLNNGTFPATSIWTTGSSGYSLKVFPDVNNYANSELTASKGYFGVFSRGTSSPTIPMAYNYYVAAGTENDGILGVFKPNASVGYWEWSFLGTYIPRPELSSSILNPVIASFNGESSSDFGTSISTTTQSSRSVGMILRTAQSESDSVTFVDANWWEKVGNLKWNTLLGGPPKQEIFDVGLQVNSAIGQGFIGWVGNTLQKCIAGTETDDLSLDENNIVFGASTTTSHFKLLAPWSSSVGGPPGTHSHRTGSQF